MSYFSELYSEIKYPIATDLRNGLRNAQIGAIHALAAHSTIKPMEAAIIVMPTGSGKTTVLMMAPYILQKSKVLIVTPSAMVRGQISEEFRQLKTLKALHVLKNEIAPPVVYEASHLYSEENDREIRNADVVVASHQVAASISESKLKEAFDYVIIDEAHHVPAPTWQRILHNLNHAAALLVTATPFRLDRKEIEGTHIYNYPLSKAYRDGIFGSISFIPIDESPNKDTKIAKEAERVFLNDRAEGFEHFLLVRTDTREKAKLLELLYHEETSLRLKRIDSSMSFKTIKKTIQSLRAFELDGIICVDMLGEGFDFPNLKIAAIHEPHKSLASTLQFVGRFSRTNADNIGTAKFIAMNDEELQIENRKLYTSDAIWQDIIIEMSETKINDDLENSEVIKRFTRPEEGENFISLHNVRPNCHARVYRIHGFDIYANFPDAICVQKNEYRSIDSNTVVGIAMHNTVPLWLDSDQAVNSNISLYIVHYQHETGLMYIYANPKTERVYEDIANAFCSDYQKIPRNEMNRVLAGFSNYEFFNTGMQNRYAEAGESYRIYAGSNTAASIDETTGKMLSAGHAFCKVSQEDGLSETIGYSSGSKFWSSSYLSIPDYISWCDTVGKKIVNSHLRVKTNTNFDNLPIPTGITKYEESVRFGFFSEKAYISPPTLRIDGQDKIIGVLTDSEIIINGVTHDGSGIIFEISIGDYKEKYRCDTNGIYSSDSDQIVCRDGIHREKLSDYFTEHPLTFKSTDDTSYCGNEVLKSNYKLEQYNHNSIKCFDWESYNTDITSEVNSDKFEKPSIQETIRQHLLKNTSYSHIIFDHGTGEIADFITFKSEESILNVGLYHCKAMKGSDYNSSLGDVYEVAQQAVKSTIWVKSKSFLLDKVQKRIRSGVTDKFVKGDIKSLKELLQSRRLMVTTIYIVQPALSASKDMPDKISAVLSAASSFINHTGRIKELKVIGS